jgi:hypothetical protein
MSNKPPWNDALKHRLSRAREIYKNILRNPVIRIGAAGGCVQGRSCH